MNSIKFPSNNQNNKDESKSDSTIQLEFSESVVRMLAKTHDMNSNSYASLQRYYSRKRCASRESQTTIDEEQNINKKQRNNDDRLAFSKNTRNQQIISLSEPDESECIRTETQPQQRNGKIVFQLIKS
jgi:hypothetical protein